MIPFHVAVVVRTRNIGWIQVNKVKPLRFQVEHISAFDGMSASIIEDNSIENFNLLEKVFLD